MASGSVRVELFRVSSFDTLDASSDSWMRWGVCRKRTFLRTAYCWDQVSEHDLYYGWQVIIAIWLLYVLQDSILLCIQI